jgi:hypothetical protein
MEREKAKRKHLESQRDKTGSLNILWLSLSKWRLVWRLGKSGKEPFYVKLPFNKDDEPCTNEGYFT